MEILKKLKEDHERFAFGPVPTSNGQKQDSTTILQLIAEVERLTESLAQLRDDIINFSDDTIWVGLSETACERITSILGDDWGEDGKCEARTNEKIT
jgi:hypothetical protein